jgi:hypothetical protein
VRPHLPANPRDRRHLRRSVRLAGLYHGAPADSRRYRRRYVSHAAHQSGKTVCYALCTHSTSEAGKYGRSHLEQYARCLVYRVAS